MFYLMATVGIVAFAFAACVIVLILIDRKAREVIQKLPTSQGKRECARARSPLPYRR